MKIDYTTIVDVELPMKLEISFRGVYDFYKKYANDLQHPYYKSALSVLEEIDKYPFLIEGFSDYSLLEKHKAQVELLMNPLFPDVLLNNEIKIATLPFTFLNFKYTTRFENILKNAGDDFSLSFRSLDDNEIYIQACTFILAHCHNFHIDLRRPWFFEIPNKSKGTNNHYRVTLNGDFSEFEITDKAPAITEVDYKMLLDNYENIEVWKEKFPPGSYIFKGFVLMNLFDVTAEETLSQLKDDLLKKDDNILEKVERNLREFFGINDLKVGYSVFDFTTNMTSARIKKSQSLIVKNIEEINGDFFCEGIINNVIRNEEVMAISNVETYGKANNYNLFYQSLKSQDIESIILVPLRGATDLISLLEIASPRVFELNSVNKTKLKDVIPVFKTAVERLAEEEKNLLESFIQENYTSIHPAVKWRFYESAENYFDQKLTIPVGQEPKVEEVVFNEVYPLFAQLDIKGSSDARNSAIQGDLTTQLSLSIEVLDAACKKESLPIYEELTFRVHEYLDHVHHGLNAGDEIGILDFLTRDIYPVFNHLKEVDSDLKKHVEVYMNRLDPDLHVVYEKRKSYEDSVTFLNKKLAKFLDKKEDEAQGMFPHYFERYLTDGVEYNIYIGQSLVKDKIFNELYLYNLRLWQLQNICEMENIAHQSLQKMDHQLRIASLVLVHSNPLAIKFRMDEKQFDVDGAYNIRYEIIKKRIDKAHIKNTSERLTAPGKIAIVYSQDKDAVEYKKYIKYLQSKSLLGKLEQLDLEDLQGVYGLKALRVEVIYHNDFNEQPTITMEEIMKEIKD
jgi:hypothetical protein